MKMLVVFVLVMVGTLAAVGVLSILHVIVMLGGKGVAVYCAALSHPETRVSPLLSSTQHHNAGIITTFHYL